MNVSSLMCERARGWSSSRVDGELSELESGLLYAHLGRCGACREFARNAESVAAVLSAARLERPAPLALVVPRPTRPRRMLRAAAAGCVVVLAAIIVGIAGSGAPGASRAVAAKPVAMVSALDTPNELRRLRRASLIEHTREGPRNRQWLRELY
jgi:predicted anti-sigma-YlaC factor YlaD